LKRIALFRHIFLTVFVLLLGFVLVGCDKSYKTKVEGDFKLIKIKNKWYIDGLVDAERKWELVIPSTLDVYGIREKAFCDKKGGYDHEFDPSLEGGITGTREACYNNTLRKVTIEKELKQIDKGAFYGCRTLEKVILPENVTKICDLAFCKCKILEDINIPNNVTKIGNYSFAYCNKIKEVDFSKYKNLNNIGECAFAHCESLEKMLLPENITIIKDGCFLFCESLKSVTIPEKVTIIEESAFNGVYAVEGIIILGKIKKVGISSFTCHTIFFKGSVSDWDKVRFYDSTNPKYIYEDYDAITRYVKYYSEDRPSNDLGLYWHYVNDEPTIWS